MARLAAVLARILTRFAGRSGPRQFGRALLVLLALAGHAAWQPALAADEFLEPEKAFQFSARQLDPKTVEVTFDIAPGYYLYREQFRFAAEGAMLGTALIPPGKVKFDETFQKNVETYRDVLKISVPVQSAAAGEFRLITTSQGCADAGLCYPPMQSAASVSLAGFGGSGIVRPVAAAELAMPRVETAAAVAAAGTSAAAPAAATGGELGAIESVLRGGSFWPVVGAFFLAGLLLSLTPCVLPMLPIVSSIIVGQAGYDAVFAGVPAGSAASGRSPRAISRSRGFGLAASYSFGMAVVYTLFGVAAGLAGEGLAAALQNPWVLGAFALGLVALSLSMFGLYNVQMPSALACRFASAAQRMPAGRTAGVFAMGGVSALIVSPCVAAPLAGALLYLSQTRDVWLGGTALFSLAAGMSVPLL
ncbi:MAG TPA: protein-disulfide reductase DsbD domain-containing protein, partial [Caldimonas sp.]